MIRRAILIAATHRVVPSDDLSGTRLMGKFLSSAIGGAWAQDEIVELECPSREDILRVKGSLSDHEYVVIYLAGKGGIRKSDLPWPQLYLTLPSGEFMDENEINPGAQRSLLLFDFSEDCQAYQADVVDVMARDQNVTECRREYDAHLKAAESGIVTVSNFKAKDTSVSASLATSLVVAALTSLKSAVGVLDVQQVAANAATESKTEIAYSGGRRLRHFPFAVRV